MAVTNRKEVVMRRQAFGWMSAGLVLAAMTAIGCSAAVKPAAIRPPAAPLVACDPYFSVWSGADRLTDKATNHWTGKRQTLTGMVRVDGKAYRVMGDEPKAVEAMEQKSLTVWPTRTVYEFANAAVKVTLTFMTPALPEDLDMLSWPVTYVVWDAVSADGKEHEVTAYLSASSELAVNEASQKVVWSRKDVGTMTTLRIGSEEQPVLQKRGDDMRIDWGYAIVGVAKEAATAIGAETACVEGFVASGKLPAADDTRMPRAVSDEMPTMAAAMAMGKVAAKPVRRVAMLAYDDGYSINFMGQKLRPYWGRKGMTADAMLTAAWGGFAAIEKRCIAFDEELTADMTRIGGANYAAICAGVSAMPGGQQAVRRFGGQPDAVSEGKFQQRVHRDGGYHLPDGAAVFAVEPDAGQGVDRAGAGVRGVGAVEVPVCSARPWAVSARDRAGLWRRRADRGKPDARRGKRQHAAGGGGGGQAGRKCRVSNAVLATIAEVGRVSQGQGL